MSADSSGSYPDGNCQGSPTFVADAGYTHSDDGYLTVQLAMFVKLKKRKKKKEEEKKKEKKKKKKVHCGIDFIWARYGSRRLYNPFRPSLPHTTLPH